MTVLLLPDENAYCIPATEKSSLTSIGDLLKEIEVIDSTNRAADPQSNHSNFYQGYQNCRWLGRFV